MKLKGLFILRHGESDHEGFLTPAGRALIQQLGHGLKNRYKLDRKKTEIICSRELRALKTAQELRQAIGLEPDYISRRVVCHKELFSDDRVCDIEGALRVIAEYDGEVDVLIVVTHYEMALWLPRVFGHKVLRVNNNFPEYSYRHGQGCLIDCEKGTCEQIILEPR